MKTPVGIGHAGDQGADGEHLHARDKPAYHGHDDQSGKAQGTRAAKHTDRAPEGLPQRCGPPSRGRGNRGTRTTRIPIITHQPIPSSRAGCVSNSQYMFSSNESPEERDPSRCV